MIEEIAKMQKEEEIIYNSMFCTYMILTKQSTIEDLFESGNDFGIMFNPDEFDKLTTKKIIDLIDYLIDFFVEVEEYEKCQDLVDAKKLYVKKKKKSKSKKKGT
tara:strand:+ start:308 stop:619 length:312 start_codon:yes stop_codon:yes gene_type:complete